MRLIYIVLLQLILTGCASIGPPARGLWVPSEGGARTLDSRQNIDLLFVRAKELGLSDIFVQVYRGDRSWYPSAIADDEPSSRAGAGRDGTLKYMIRRARQSGLRLHAWINVFNISGNKDARVLNKLGPGAMTRDSEGRTTRDYFEGKGPQGYSLDAPGIWLDPGAPEVRKYLLSIVEELISSHNELAGLHLDFIRYPYLLPMMPGSSFPGGHDFGYAERSVEKFKAEAGVKLLARPNGMPYGRSWDDWRRDQVSEFVRQAKTLLKSQDEKMKLSVAALPWPDRAYLTAFQDWRGWLEEGLVDFVVVMNYSKDVRLANYIGRQALAFRAGKKVYIGLGAYLFADDYKGLQEEMADARRLGAHGIVLFSYDALASHPELMQTIAEAW